MRIRKLEAANFMRHDRSSVELPERGVVLVTGKNGHGKSSLVEIVSHALWDESVRGKPGWRTGAAGGARVELDDGHVLRQHSATGAKKLKWRLGVAGAADFPTTSKSQEALEAVVGSFAVWERACSFSSAEVARFTTARDADRKRLLEELLELERFDAALRRARDDVADAARRVSAAQSELAVVAERIRGLESNLAASGQLTDMLGTQADMDALREQATALKTTIVELDGAQSLLSIQHDDLKSAELDAGATVRRIQHDLARVSALKASCPTCEQCVDPDHAEDLRQCCAEALELAQEQQLTAARAVEAHYFELVDANEKCSDARWKLQEMTARGRSLKQDLEIRDRMDEGLAVVRKDLSDARARESKLSDELATAKLDAATSSACCSVLGLQGVRSALLAHALRAIEQLTNAWLDKLGMTGLSVRLESQTTAKSGTTSDKISFEVDGAGGGHGYLGSSGGERRRIDVAVMLALSEVAQRGRGVGPTSTLFVDEVFDALDEDGVEAAVEVLELIAAERCVVVVSHNRALVDRLHDATHLVVKDGAVTVARG